MRRGHSRASSVGLAILTAATLAGSAHGANVPIANGGFELPLMGPGGFTTAVPPN